MRIKEILLEHTISIREGDNTIIKPNITFRLIPGLWFNDSGVEISESILITEDGSKQLTDFPQQTGLNPVIFTAINFY